MISLVDDVLRGAKVLFKGGARKVLGNNADDIARGFRYARAPRKAEVAARGLNRSIDEFGLTEEGTEALYRGFRDKWGVDPVLAHQDPDKLVSMAIDQAKSNRGKLTNTGEYIGSALGNMRNATEMVMGNPIGQLTVWEVGLPMVAWNMLSPSPGAYDEAVDMAMQQQMMQQVSGEAANGQSLANQMLQQRMAETMAAMPAYQDNYYGGY